MITIKIIEAEEAYNLRHEILRPHQSLEDCKYDTDNKDESFHIGAFIDDKLIKQEVVKEERTFQKCDCNK